MYDDGSFFLVLSPFKALFSTTNIPEDLRAVPIEDIAVWIDPLDATKVFFFSSSFSLSHSAPHQHSHRSSPLVATSV